MEKLKCLTFSTLIAALSLAGCGEPRGEVALRPLCAPGAEKLLLMKTAEEVLAEMYFAVDKADPNVGLIRTRPLTGAQYFEFWRSDNIRPSDTFEASIQTIRRVAELTVSDQAGRLCLTCTVKTYRLNMPEHEVSGSGRAYTMFTRSNAALQRIELNPDQKAGMAWTDLGDDKHLAAEIIRRIEKRIAALREEQTI
ncbi:MAG: hypothetical protein JSU94_05125 [Phycisphaerales bacterium]|nr:MAG: hypothetical protein JSU94_05125 [Phycisphaerales bacterium]